MITKYHGLRSTLTRPEQDTTVTYPHGAQWHAHAAHAPQRIAAHAIQVARVAPRSSSALSPSMLSTRPNSLWHETAHKATEISSSGRIGKEAEWAMHGKQGCVGAERDLRSRSSRLVYRSGRFVKVTYATAVAIVAISLHLGGLRSPHNALPVD